MKTIEDSNENKNIRSWIS